MPLSTLHLAPNAPWLPLLLASLVLAALGLWAYRFAIPPLPVLARRALPALRVVALLMLAWLLAQPVLERSGGGGVHIVALLDRSASMDLPEAPGRPSRARSADRVVADLTRAWRGRASVEVAPFASALGAGSPAGTALGDAMVLLARTAEGQRA